MSREHDGPTEPLHARCAALCGRAARTAAAAQPPPGPHSRARRPGRGRREGRGAGGKGGKEAARTEESAREGRGGEGSPALRPVRGVSTAKLSQFKRRLPRPASPAGQTVRESPEEWGNEAKVEEGERPRGHSLVSPAPEWLQKRRLPREPPGSGAESHG